MKVKLLLNETADSGNHRQRNIKDVADVRYDSVRGTLLLDGRSPPVPLADCAGVEITGIANPVLLYYWDRNIPHHTEVHVARALIEVPEAKGRKSWCRTDYDRGDYSLWTSLEALTITAIEGAS